jgi:transporter family-2 protein
MEFSLLQLFQKSALLQPAGIVGQLVIGILIDHFGWFNSLIILFDLKRFFALLFMLVALYFIYTGNKRSSEETYA